MAIKKQARLRDAEATRKRILASATNIFAESGFDGARVDAIAEDAQINKQLLYHHFGNKDDLFLAVLEGAYRTFREKEAQLQLASLPADDAIMELVAFTWDYYIHKPELIKLINSENQLEARHLKASENTRSINAGHVTLLETLVRRGVAEGRIRNDIDPVDLSINIAALSFYYLMNRFTLSTVFQRDFGHKKRLQGRLETMQDVIRRWITP